MSDKVRSRIKCEGRFGSLREYLYNSVLPVVLEDRTVVSLDDLNNTWYLMEDDIYNFDPKDPYFSSKVDSLRKNPPLDPISLVPLMESPAYSLERGLVYAYSRSMGNGRSLSSKLDGMSKQSRFFRDVLKREPKTVVFPGTDITLKDYIITTDVGIGTITRGGMSGGGVRSDSPFVLEVYHQYERSHLDLAVIIGFWAQDNEMIVSQIQSCKNASLPKGVTLGEGSLYLAEIAAREMGFKGIRTYGAREHPIFKEHPEDWKQFGGDFVAIYDGSAKKLGFDGARGSSHYKDLRNH